LPNYEICVYNGTYYETLNINVVGLSLIGINRENTIINANFTNDTINVSADNIVIKNFTIKNGKENGVYANNIENLVLENCTIENNENCGILLNKSKNVKIVFSNIFENYFGVFFDEKSSNNIVYLNNFYDNFINAQNGNITNIWNDSFVGNFWDDNVGEDDYDGNGICDNIYDKFGVNDSYPLFHMYGSIVNQNTEKIFLTIQGAIDDIDTVFGNTIFVYNDTYYENLVLTKSGISLIGESKIDTIIDAGNQDKNAILIKNKENITINNFTIKNSPMTNDNSSNGVLIWAYSETPYDAYANNNTINNCIIEGNGCYGILILGSNIGQKTDSNLISNCEIFENGYCGIRITNDFKVGGFSSAENNSIINCEFYDNGFDGLQDQEMAALSISPKGCVLNTVVSDCLFYFSYGYDIHIEYGEDVHNNTFYQNNFLSNVENVYDERQNVWYNSDLVKGNYWACYDEEIEGAYDDDSDGIIDDAYYIPGGDNEDLYPLANPLGLEKPVATANGPYNAETDEAINFDATGSYDPDGVYLLYEWDLGNGEILYGKKVTYSYSNIGVFDVKLTVEDLYGLTDFYVTTATITSKPETPEEPSPPPIVEPKNIGPIADAGGPYYEMQGISIQFDGSDSYDVDGSKISYKWEFGDGNTSSSEMPIHVYSNEGNYTVKLTVKDSDGETDYDITNAFISKRPNNPPQKPIVTGTSAGMVNVTYIYSANATDPDPNDKITYVFNWSDGTNETISPELNSSEVFNATHTFTIGGIYVLTVYVVDESNTPSENQSFKILISSHKCGSLGYLIDKNGNGVYDVFYREITDRETKTQYDDADYYIDINGDENWDYTYNITTEKILKYSNPVKQKSQESELVTIWILPIIVIASILIIILAKVVSNKSPKTLKKKPKKKDKKIRKSIYMFEKEDEKIKKLHEYIDDLLEIKKNKK
jgi:PKD repeat protein